MNASPKRAWEGDASRKAEALNVWRFYGTIAQHRGIPAISLNPGEALPTRFRPEDGFLLVIQDDPDSRSDDASAGPQAFHPATLDVLLRGTPTTVISGALEFRTCTADFVMFACHPARRHAVILTGPRSHAAWTARVEAAGGHCLMHITPPGTRIDESGPDPERGQA